MNTKEKNHGCDIVAGPSVDTLLDALKYAYSKTCNIPVSFTVARGYTMPKDDPGCAYITLEMRNLKVCGVAHEDGSGHKFNIKGYCEVNYSMTVREKQWKFAKYTAFYDAQTRTGTICFD